MEEKRVVFREHVVSVRGTPENPMSTEEVEEKAMHLMAPVLGKRPARNLGPLLATTNPAAS